MLQEAYQQAEIRMQKCIENLDHALTKLRTGRAHTSLLDHVKVAYYGSDVPISQVGNVGIADARTLTVTVWDKATVTAVEKAIITAGLGLNPVSHGMVIRIPLPPLTQERRIELVKTVKSEGEEARVALRNVRRDILAQIKNLLKTKQISEDDEKIAEEKVQKIIDRYVSEVEKIVMLKEKELMQL